MKITTNEGVQNFLRSSRWGILSTVRTDCTPDSAVMYFIPHDDFSITLVTRNGTQKYKNIEKNNKVLFTIVDELNLSFLQLRGKIEPKKLKPKEFSQVINQLSEILNHKEFQVILPILKHKEAGEIVVLKFLTEEILYRTYMDDGMKEYFERM